MKKADIILIIIIGIIALLFGGIEYIKDSTVNSVKVISTPIVIVPKTLEFPKEMGKDLTTLHNTLIHKVLKHKVLKHKDAVKCNCNAKHKCSNGLFGR